MKVEIKAEKIYLVRYGSEGFYVQEEDVNTREINGKIYFALKGTAAHPPYFRLGINAFLKLEKADGKAKELNEKNGTTAQRFCFYCGANIIYGIEDKGYGYLSVGEERTVWECPVCGERNILKIWQDSLFYDAKKITEARADILEATNYTLKKEDI